MNRTASAVTTTAWHSNLAVAIQAYAQDYNNDMKCCQMFLKVYKSYLDILH